MRKLEVGVVFWQFTQLVGSDYKLRLDFLRHEVRGIVDDQFVYRRWSIKHGGYWKYSIAPIPMWNEMQQGIRAILFDQSEVREARKALREKPL